MALIAALFVARGTGTVVTFRRAGIVQTALDPAGGAEAASAAIRAAGLPSLPVSTVLRTDDYQLALIEAPDVPPAELRAAMRWRLEEAIDFAAGSDSGARLDAAGVVLKLQRSLDYYERHFDQPPITRIAVSPAGTRAAELAPDLGRETGFEVTTLDLNVLLSCATPIEPATQAACLLAVGAALREEHRSL